MGLVLGVWVEGRGEMRCTYDSGGGACDGYYLSGEGGHFWGRSRVN